MNSALKNRIIIVSATLVVIGAIGVGVYFGIQGAKRATIPGQSDQSASSGSFPISSGGGQAPNGSSGGQQTTAGQSGSLPQSAEEQQQKSMLFQLTTHPAVGFWVASSSSSSPSGILRGEAYYLNSNGDVVRIQDVGSEQVVSHIPLVGTPLWVSQNNGGSYVVVMLDSGSYALFDVQKKAWQALPDGIQSVAFSPDGKKLAFLKEVNGQTTISSMNIAAARQTVTPIISFEAVDMTLAWPMPDRIFVMSRPSSQADGQAWYVDLQKKSINFFTHGLGLQLAFQNASPYAILKFTSKNSLGKMDVVGMDKNGNVIQKLNFSTLADKCAWQAGKSFVICGIPWESTQQEGSFQLPDDYLKRAVYFHDWIDGATISSTLSFVRLMTTPTVLLDVSSPIVVGSQFFFLNRLDGTVYLYNLPS
jgi:hypothetical protein